MPVQTVTVDLPEALYAHLHEQAERARRSLEAEVLAVLTTLVPDSSEPLPVAETLKSLEVLDDEDLKRAAHSRLDPEIAKELDDLHLKRQRQGLTETETETLKVLVRHYERAMLIRARAAELLQERGHDASQFLSPP